MAPLWVLLGVEERIALLREESSVLTGEFNGGMRGRRRRVVFDLRSLFSL